MKKLNLTIIGLILFAFTLNAQETSNEKANQYYNEGYSLVGIRNFEKGIKILKKAIIEDPSGDCGTGIKGMAQSEVGYSYMRLNNSEKALEYFDLAIKLNSENPWPRYNKSVVYSMIIKDNRKAIEEIDKLIENVPTFALGYFQRGLYLGADGEYEKAINDFENYLKIIKEQGQEAEAGPMLGKAKDKIKEYKEKIK